MSRGFKADISVLFVDIVGSTKILETFSYEETDEIFKDINHFFSQKIQKYKGIINQVLGDGVMALFGLDQEDHSLRACLAAQEIALEIESYTQKRNWPIKVRCGIDCGTVILHESDAFYRSVFRATGEAVHMAARAEHNARINSVCVTKRVFDKLQEFGDFTPIEIDPSKNYTNNNSFYTVDKIMFDNELVVKMNKDEILLCRKIEKKLINTLENQNFELIKNPFLIHGEAGFGKTSLIKNILNKLTNVTFNIWKFKPSYVPQAIAFFDFIDKTLIPLKKNRKVIILEDLHYASETEIKLIKETLQKTKNINTVFILTSRNTNIKNDFYCKLLELKPFSQKETFEYINRYFSNNQIPKFIIKSIAQGSNGHPLLLKEICSKLKYRDIYSLNFDNELSFSNISQITSIHHAKYFELDDIQKEIINYISTLGFSVPLSSLSDLTNIKKKDLFMYLSDLENRELVTKKVINNDITYSCFHELQKQSIYSFILEKDKKRIHERIFYLFKDKERTKHILYRYNHLARHAMRSGMYKRAFYYFKLSCRDYEQKGEFNKALECLSEMYKIISFIDFQKIHVLEKKLDIDLNKARLYLASANFNLFQQQIENIQNANEYQNIVYNNERYIHLVIALNCRLGNLNKAELFTLNALKNPLLKKQDKYTDIWLNSQLSEIYLEKGDFEKAKQCIYLVRKFTQEWKTEKDKLNLLANPIALSYAFETKIEYILCTINKEDRLKLLNKCLKFQNSIEDIFTQSLIFCCIHKALEQEKGLKHVLHVSKKFYSYCIKNEITLLSDYCQSIYGYYLFQDGQHKKGLKLLLSGIKNTFDQGLDWPGNSILTLYINCLISVSRFTLADKLIDVLLQRDTFKQEIYSFDLMKQIKNRIKDNIQSNSSLQIQANIEDIINTYDYIKDEIHNKEPSSHIEKTISIKIEK